MTTDSGVIIPSAMSELVDARNAIWDQNDKSQTQAAALKKLAGQIPGGAASIALEPLTKGNTAPAELAAALPQLEQELAHVREIQTAIQERHTEIARLKNQATMIVIGVVVTIVVVLIIIVGSIHQ